LATPETTALEICKNVGSRLALMGKKGRGHLHELESEGPPRVAGRRLADDECVVLMADYVFVSEQPVDA
jgi:hypothetical protein